MPSDGGVRVPDERLDAREANLTAALTWVPHPYRVPATEDMAALVADLRAARADNQRLREHLAALVHTFYALDPAHIPPEHERVAVEATHALREKADSGSFSGRTPGFDPGDAGSTPAPGIKGVTTAVCGCVVTFDHGQWVTLVRCV